MPQVLTMIMAGGKGTRMEVLCQRRAKPVIPFAGVLRVIDFTLSNCANSGMGTVGILTDYEKESVREYVGNGSAWGFPAQGSLNLLESRHNGYRGTADAVFQNVAFIEDFDPETVLILAADHVYQMDYRPLIAFHRQAGVDVTIAATQVPREEAHRFGILTTDDRGRLLTFEEKPESPNSSLASMGIYVFRKDSLKGWLKANAQDPSSTHDFGRAIIPRAVAEGKAAAYEFKGDWRDIGTVQSYYEANMATLRQSPYLLRNSWPILTQRQVLPPPKLSPLARVRESIVSEGCQIMGEVVNSVLSPGVRVEAGAVVKDSILMTNTRVGRYSRVERAIVDEEVSIGEFCRVGSLQRGSAKPRRPTIIGYGTNIPSHTAVVDGVTVPQGGQNCRLFEKGVGFAELESVA